MPKYDIEVQLTGQDGNAFAIIGAVQKALRNGGVPADEIAAVRDDMMSGDYDHLLRVAMETVDVL
jgi:hypothetical protein